MKRILLLVMMSVCSMQMFAVNDTIYPADTLLTSSIIAQFNTAEILVAWTPGFCAVKVTMGGDTTYAPCYTVTYRDHYVTDITLCPENMDSVGGLGLHMDVPWLLDSNLFNQGRST